MAKVLNPIQISRELTAPPGRLLSLRRNPLLAPGTAGPAVKQAFIMLRPDIQWKNPVMFVVEVGAFLTLFYVIQAFLGKSESQVSIGYFVALDIWLFLTVLFANFATAVAEARGKAQTESLRRARHDTVAHRLTSDRSIEEVSSSVLKPGDLVVVKAGQFIPGDGEIVKGVASIDESAISGESAPVIREAGGDRSGVTGGTLVVSDQIVIKITSGAGESFLDRMIALVEGAIRQRTPNEIALTLVLSAFSLIFLIVVIPLWPMALNAEQYIMSYLGLSDPLKSLGTDVPTLIALLVCLIPTTIGALLAAIGIAGMDRALRANVMAKSGKAVETAGDIDVVLLDKTGTITVGNRHATTFLPVDSYSPLEVGRLAFLASAADETPEGKTIVSKAKELRTAGQETLSVPDGSDFVAFTAQTRMSGVDLVAGHKIRKGAPDAIVDFVKEAVKEGSDIQRSFFDMWRQEHPDAELQDVPGDLVMASGSGLDPDITLENAEFQLDRVAAKWADDTKRDAADIRKEIDQILQANASAAFGGLAGEKFVNVLEVNLELCQRYGLPR